jgi:signal peptidase I
VKRLIVLPGETWRMEDGVVYIGGKKLVEPYLSDARRGHDIQQPKKVPPGHYVMLGDNRDHSCDSRQWGAVPRDNLIGKVIATYWPPARLSLR